MVARVSGWLIAGVVTLGCGRTEAPRGAMSEAAGATAGVPTSEGVGGGAVVTGGAAAGGIATGGTATGGAGGSAVRPVDPSLPSPSLRLPQNGRATGSVWAERSRRPRFAWSAQP